MNPIARWFPALAAVFALAWIGMVGMRSTRGPEQVMPIGRIAALPVSSGGRTKPLDTFARSTLLRLSGRQTYEADGAQRSATEWILELWTRPDVAADRRVFRVDHPDVRSLLALTDATRTRFSWKEIEPKLDEVVRQAQMASQISRKQQDPFQRQISDLYGKLAEYADVQVLRAPYMVAPLDSGEQWVPITSSDPHAQEVLGRRSAKSLQTILAGYARGDADATTRAVDAYEAELARALPSEKSAGSLEVVFNRFEPFYQASILYVVAFLAGCFGLLAAQISPNRWRPALWRSALALIAIAFIVQTAGLGARIYLQGRPPVTNLYSSAVFIGWACVPLALIGEWYARLGFFSAAASLIGFASLVVAHNLSSSGDTMEMMQAVLDSNFWLATHVVVVTIGYSATFLAGFLAIFYAVGGVFTRFLQGEAMKALPRMIYGVVCFAAITSFVGTVLGGIWADQSWGRFWGWDPKENGAALIVLWNLLILHARWGGMIRDRGVAALAIGGNIVTAWSWFGTNMLGVGLHSYGFMDSAVFALLVFCIVQLVLVGVAMVPVARWRSLAAA
ncbi:MAG: Cytochrome c biosis protein CcsA [Planctomycetota bacterium]|jgi:ABC-type transport system involved in cytochrome c biogenesis permease subunit